MQLALGTAPVAVGSPLCPVHWEPHAGHASTLCGFGGGLVPWPLPIPKACHALPGCTAWGNRGFSLQAGAAVRGDLGEEDSQRVFPPPPPRADCLLVGSLKINPSWRRSALFPPQMASSNPTPWQRLLLIFSVGTHPGGCPDLARPWDILRTRGPARPCSHPRRAALGRKRRRRRDGGSWQAP